MKRCAWCEKDDLYRAYHDEEWGSPVHDEGRHFEFLLLEMMQAGLSWYTILAKRENFRAAFDGFDWRKIARYDAVKVDALLADKGIIRNRRKIEAAIKNALGFLDIQDECGSFDSYIWSWVGGRAIINKWSSLQEIPATTVLSDAVSKDLKKRGFSFVGSTTIYSHLQAIGVVNDHVIGCFRRKEIIMQDRSSAPTAATLSRSRGGSSGAGSV
jgi:DNA-3-methyladenine glycosylase I